MIMVVLVMMFMRCANQMTDSVYFAAHSLRVLIQINQRIQYHVTAYTVFTIQIDSFHMYLTPLYGIDQFYCQRRKTGVTFSGSSSDCARLSVFPCLFKIIFLKKAIDNSRKY